MPRLRQANVRLSNGKRPDFIRWVVLGCIAAFMLAAFWAHQLSPAVANSSSRNTTARDAATKATVVVDGRAAFQVGPVGEYSAQQRAAQVNQPLQLLADFGSTVSVDVIERNQLPTIVANEQYLLTVTELDAAFNKTPTEQAQDWANQLGILLRQAQQERQPDYLRYAAWLSGFALLAAALLHWLFGRLYQRRISTHTSTDRSNSKIASKTDQKTASKIAPKAEIPIVLGKLLDGNKSPDGTFSAGVLLTVARLLTWLTAFWYISSLFPQLRQRRYNFLRGLTVSTKTPLVELGEQSYTLVDLLILLGLLWGLFTLVQLSVRILTTQVLPRTQLARGAREIVIQTYRYGALAIGTLILLQAWGIDLRSIALLGSALGIGIGFGFQDIAKNFGSGLVLLFERSIQVGDFIEVGEQMGSVERIGARSITIRTLDNISVLVPNANLIGTQVLNWNHGRHPVSRLHITVGVAYGSDPQQVKSALMQAAQEHGEVLPRPSPDVFLKSFGDSAPEFDLLVWIRKPEYQVRIQSDLNYRIEEILKAQNISIPFPQRDFHLKTEQVPISFSPELMSAIAQIIKNDNLPATKEDQQ
ncbi:MAG: mechanosensitive ion channel domain-containing protein [Cyanobacteria bacterium J06643_4]